MHNNSSEKKAANIFALFFHNRARSIWPIKWSGLRIASRGETVERSVAMQEIEYFCGLIYRQSDTRPVYIDCTQLC